MDRMIAYLHTEVDQGAGRRNQDVEDGTGHARHFGKNMFCILLNIENS